MVYYGDNVTMGYATSGDDLIKSDEWHGRLNTGDMEDIITLLDVRKDLSKFSEKGLVLMKLKCA